MLLFVVEAVGKALLSNSTVEVSVFSKEDFSVLQSVVWIGAVLMENLFLLSGDVHVVSFSFSVNVNSGKSVRYC